MTAVGDASALAFIRHDNYSFIESHTRAFPGFESAGSDTVHTCTLVTMVVLLTSNRRLALHTHDTLAVDVPARANYHRVAWAVE